MRNVFTTLDAPLTFIDPEMPLSLDNRRDNNKEDGHMEEQEDDQRKKMQLTRSPRGS